MEKILSVVNYVGILPFFHSPMLRGTATLVILASLFFAANCILSTNKKKWPPSPPRLPLIGNLHQIMMQRGNLLSTCSDMANIYGPVMTVWIGPMPVVILTGQTAIWEALVNQGSNFAGRPQFYSRKFTSANYKTMVSSAYDEHGIKLRKVLNSNVLSSSHLASHSSSHETSVRNLIKKLQKEMEVRKGVVRPFQAVKIMTISFIARLCLGSHFQDESFFVKVEQLITQEMSITNTGDMLLDSFAYARYFIPSSIRTERIWKALRADVLQLFLPLIQSARSYSEYFKQSAPNCFLNCLLSIGEGEAEQEHKLKLSDEEIAFNLFELFFLAVDSTSTAIEWALAYLINHPHIQKRVYQEVNQAMQEGEDELLRLEDLGKLPYLQAVVKETLRKEPILPIGLLHETVNECKVMGMNIPAKAGVLYNLYGASNDPAVWKEPDEFKPERFLSNMDSNKLRKSYLPFGAGKRVCPGMHFTSVHVPITLANLLNKFEWGCAKGGSPPDLTRDMPTVFMYMKYRVEARIVCR